MSLIRWITKRFIISGLIISVPASLAFSSTNQPIDRPNTSHIQLEDLPTGQYYYEVPTSLTQAEPRFVLLRKAGRGIIGLDRRSTSNICFRGFLEGDRIINAVRVFPPYHPDSKWDAREGELMNLSRYQQVDRKITTAEATALQTCLQFFSR
jgi:hypothetical protein